MDKVAVHPARHRYYSPQLATMASGVHGYQATCTCGWKGEVRDRWGTARYDATVHRQSPHAAAGGVVDDTPPNNATD